MQKSITARHFDLTPELKTKADEEINGLTRYFDNIISAELVLEAERHRRTAELNVRVYNQTISGSAETDDMLTAITAATDKVVSQLKKYKGKLKDKKAEVVTGLKGDLTKPSTDVDAIDQ